MRASLSSAGSAGGIGHTGRVGNATRSRRRRTAVAAVASCAIALVLASCGHDGTTAGTGTTADANKGTDATAVDAGESALDSYSWQELSAISAEVAAAPDDAAALEVARSYGLVTEDGRIDASQTKGLTLDDGTPARVRLVGLRADTGDDGVAGLTFAFDTPLVARGVNDAATTTGGWAESDLRAWLASDGLALLPDDLESLVTPVRKRTVCEPGGEVVETTDALWLFSESELGGEGYLVDSYGPLADAMLDEGVTYQLFAQGLADAADFEPAFVRSSALSGAWTCWWERSLNASAESFLFRSYNGVHTVAIGYSANFDLGVCPGFCL